MKKIINILVETQNTLLESQVKPEGIVPPALLRLKHFYKVLLVTIKLTNLFHFLDKKEKLKKICSNTFTLTITLMTLAAAVIPFLIINSSDTTTVDTTTSTVNAIGKHNIKFNNG